MKTHKKYALILVSWWVPALLFAQIPTNVDVDTGKRDLSIWENPWYILGLITIVAVAIIILRWRRKR